MPYVSWDRLQRPRDPNEDEAVLIMDDNGYIFISAVKNNALTQLIQLQV